MAYRRKTVITNFFIMGIVVLSVKMYFDVPIKEQMDSKHLSPNQLRQDRFKVDEIGIQRTYSSPTDDLKSQKKTCQEVRHIVFAKTHKTGSTTLRYILHQIRNAKVTALQGIPFGVYGGYPAPFNASIGYYATANRKYKLFEPGETVGFISGHMVFNKDEIKKIVPEDTKYLTILRNPISQIPSTFNFYFTMRHSLCNIYQCLCSPFLELTNNNRSRTVEEFMELPLQYVNRSVPMFFRARNFQAYDLGLDAMNEDKDYLISKTKELDATFDLVLITEYFDESLVLMKNLLCTTFEKIYYYSKNRRVYEKPEISAKVLDGMMKFYYQDFYLYDYFNKTLWRKIDEFGREKFERELQTFREFMEQKDAADGKEEEKYVEQKDEITYKNYPYYYPVRFQYIFNNPGDDKTIEITQRMKYEAVRLAQGHEELEEFLQNVNFDDFGSYVAQYTEMCKVRRGNLVTSL